MGKSPDKEILVKTERFLNNDGPRMMYFMDKQHQFNDDVTELIEAMNLRILSLERENKRLKKKLWTK